MWGYLRNRQFNNLKFRRQHILYGYIVDFYCAELRLAIEIDGLIHFVSKKQMFEDEDRQKNIEDFNIIFFRTTSKEAEYNINSVLDNLNKFIQSL